MILGHGDKVWQEFYCRHCPADDPASKDPEKLKTGGHFRVKFHLGYDAQLTVVCPKCKHEHTRAVKDGVILDSSSSVAFKDRVTVPLSAWSRDPFTKKAAEVKAANPKDNYCTPIRGSNVIASPDDLSAAAKAARPRTGGRAGFLQIHDPDAPANDAGADGSDQPNQE